MRFCVIAFVCLLVSFSPATADKFADAQPFYTYLSTNCGKQEFHTSQSDYVFAFSEAAKARKDAAKLTNSKSQIAAIDAVVAKLQECQDAEETKFYIPKTDSCSDVIYFYRQFVIRAADLVERKKITKDDRMRVRETFRGPLQECLRKQTSTCLDPTNTEQVDEVIGIFLIASKFDLTTDQQGMNDLERLIAEKNPFSSKIKLCTDTDYACKNTHNDNGLTCANRERGLKYVLQAYLK